MRNSKFSKVDRNQFIFVKDDDSFGEGHFTVTGQININNAAYMKQELEKHIASGSINIVINMCSVTFLSSTGIRTILSIYKKTKELGGKLLIENPSECVRNVIGMVALDEMLLK